MLLLSIILPFLARSENIANKNIQNPKNVPKVKHFSILAFDSDPLSHVIPKKTSARFPTCGSSNRLSKLDLHFNRSRTVLLFNPLSIYSHR